MDCTLQEGAIGLQYVALYVVITLFETLNKKTRVLLINSSKLIRSRTDKCFDQLNCSTAHLPRSVIIIFIGHLLIFEIRAPTCIVTPALINATFVLLVSVVGIKDHQVGAKCKDVFDMLINLLG